MTTPTRQSPGETLNGAIEKFTEPNAWFAYCKLKSDADEVRRYVNHDGRTVIVRQPNPFANRLECSRQKIVADFSQALVEGKLIATAIEWPDGPLKVRIQVPGEKWPRLEFNFGDSSANGDGYRLIDIRVTPAPGLTWESARAQACPSENAANAPIVRRGPGRPSALDKIKEKMAERAQNHQLRPSLKQEAGDLEEWNSAQPGHRKVSAKTICNNLGETYRRLRDASLA
jgi:hypothetical protein